MTHHHHHAPQRYGRLFAIGISLNLIYVALEAFYGWQSGSLALLADAGHNLSDVTSLILAWIGFAAGKLKPTKQFTFGWKKMSIFASFINAIILLFAMGILASEAIARFNTPTELHAVTIIWVAAIGVVINGLTAWLFIKGSKEDLNIKGAFLHMAADTLVSLAVVISGVIYLVWQLAWLDPMMSLLVALVVVIGTWSLFKSTIHLMFDGVPEGVDMQSIVKYMNAHPSIASFHDLHIRALSTSENSLSVHIVKLENSLTDDDLLKQVTETIQHQFNVPHVTVQIESEPYSQTCKSMHCTDT
ncbi:cation diffusion facilitator family transporter [Thalassotalea piscium]